MTHAPIAITCGDPAGVGPEISVAAWRAVRGDIPCVWIGDPRHLPPGTPCHDFSQPGAADSLPVMALDFADASTPGTPSLANAPGVVAAIKAAVAGTQAGTFCGICTAPIHKQILADGAAFQHPGHTEFLADLAGKDIQPVMMLASPDLRVVPLTIHIPIKDVPRAITPELIRQTVDIIRADMGAKFGLSDPRICVAGLNPHASEGGKIGREDLDIVAPTVQALAQDGVTIWGPVSADTMFHPAARATYDVALCMYHDQALIPLKTLDFSGGVNVTLGLPFVRTSPDHGTAFDIAGTGQADPASMIAALRMAWDMAQSGHATHGD